MGFGAARKDAGGHHREVVSDEKCGEANGRLISESSFSNGFMAILVGRLQGMVSTAVILDQSQRSFG